MTRLELFKTAREKIEEGWCQYEPAVTADGYQTHTTATNAARWCAVGAIQAAVRGVKPGEMSRLIDEGISTLCNRLGVPVAGWNDTEGRTKEEVLTLYDSIITDLQEEELWK